MGFYLKLVANSPKALVFKIIMWKEVVFLNSHALLEQLYSFFSAIVNPCANVSCGGLCVVSPGAVRHRCVCPYQHQLNSDGTCQPLGFYMLIAYSRKVRKICSIVLLGLSE